MTNPTRVGSRVRLCFNAKLGDTVGAPPLVRARLSRIFTVDAMTGPTIRSTGEIGQPFVRVAHSVWSLSWVRVP